MKTRRLPLLAIQLLVAALTLTFLPCGHAGSVERTAVAAEKPDDSDDATSDEGDEDADKASDADASKSAKRKYDELVKGAKTISGLIRLHRKDEKLYGEIPRSELSKDLIVVIAIARGIGESPLLGGMTWSMGDDWIWQFRKTDKRIQIVRRNVRFQADKDSPQEKAVHLAYTDSVLFSLPIVATSPGGADVVDLTPVFMSDLPQISQVLSGFSFSRDKSTWATVKGFKDNIELQVAATYASGGTVELDTVPDSRGLTVHVHYSISRLPKTGYKPREADDRVGYFVTALMDYSKTADFDRFVRYVNRWDLQKADPSADVSPPKTPIIFWLEKTIPFKYRNPIREGIQEWNKAFEKAGFVDAIEVRQQPDDADWDPEDIHYNTFRWITASAGFAMGPSRVNPINGQILDADIILDSDFVRYWKDDYEIMTPASAASLTGGPLDVHEYEEQFGRIPPALREHHAMRCGCADGMARQLAFGTLMLADDGKPASQEEIDELIAQGLKEVVTHEVGHTLGLRHNFKGSAYLTLDELNDADDPRSACLGSSVMDYLPMNVVPKGQKHSTFFSTTIGPYDYWAIEYGYKTVKGKEAEELEKIASRCAEPALDYATDEDTRSVDPDPLSNRYDLGKDPVEYARRQAELIAEAMPDLVERVVADGDGYQRARRAFNVLLSEHGRAMQFAARFVGGLYVHRDHRGDPDARPPYEVVDAQKQREAMTLLEQHVFGRESYQFPPELYNHLGHTNWNHWGTTIPSRVDYAIENTILTWQERVLSQLLSSLTLSRLADSQMRVPTDEEVFTAAELIERLTKAIFIEIEDLGSGDYTVRNPAINSLRRNLQQSYVERLADLALGNTGAPEDCRSLADAELESLEARIKRVLAGKAQLDTYTRAHLNEMAVRIRRVLDARLQTYNP